MLYKTLLRLLQFFFWPTPCVHIIINEVAARTRGFDTSWKTWTANQREKQDLEENWHKLLLVLLLVHIV